MPSDPTCDVSRPCRSLNIIPIIFFEQNSTNQIIDTINFTIKYNLIDRFINLPKNTGPWIHCNSFICNFLVIKGNWTLSDGPEIFLLFSFNK